MTKKPRLPKSMRKTDLAVSREREIMRAVSDLEISIGMSFKLFRNRVANIFAPGSVTDVAAIAPPDPASTEIDPRFFESTLARDAPTARGRRRSKEAATNGSSVVDALYHATAPVAANVDTSALPPLGTYARLILGVLVRFGKPCSTAFVAIVLGRSISGSFTGAVAELRAHGYVDGSNRALRVVREPEAHLDIDRTPLPKGADLLRMWEEKLEPIASAILRTLVHEHPTEMSAADVASATDYKQSGSFTGALGKMRKLELIDGPNRALRLHESFAQAIGSTGVRR